MRTEASDTKAGARISVSKRPSSSTSGTNLANLTARANPYTTYRRLRSLPPERDADGQWIFSRYAHVQEALNNDHLSPYTHHALNGDHLHQRVLKFISDPANTPRLELVGTLFCAEAVSIEVPCIERICRDLVCVGVAKSGMDLVGEFASGLATRLTCERLAISGETAPALRTWAGDILALLDVPSPRRDELTVLDQSLSDGLSFLKEVAAARRWNPGTDVISILLSYDRNEEVISDEDVAFICLVFLLTSLEISVHLVGNTCAALLGHREQADLLRRNPELADTAVAEAIRFNSPIHQIVRYAHADTTIGSHAIRAGDRILLLPAAANHDVDVFTDADQFIIERENADHHIGFDVGLDAFRGALLARKQAAIAARHLFSEGLNLQAIEPTLDWQAQQHSLRGLRSLPVALSRSR